MDSLRIASRSFDADLAWSIEHECAASLCDVLERRVRVAVFAKGQGLPELTDLARTAQQAAGWSDAETQEQRTRYEAMVHERYTVRS